MNTGILLRILGPMGVLSLLLLAVGVLAAGHIETQQQLHSELIHREFRGMLVIEELYVKMRDIRWECSLFDRSGDERHLQSVIQLLDASLKPLYDARQAARTPEESQRIENVERGFKRFREVFTDFKNGSGKITQEQIRQLSDIQLTREILQPIEECLRYSQLVVERADETADAAARNLRLGFLLLGITGCIAGLFVGVGVSRALSRSIVQLDISVRSMAGKLNEVSQPVHISQLTDLQGVENGVRNLATELGAIVRRLQRQETEILRAEQLATLGQLAAGMAHELRNPLTPVKMLVQGAIEQGSRGGLVGRDLEIVNDEVERMEQTIQSFLDFARPPAPEPTLTCVCKIIRNASDLVAAQAQRCGVEIRTDFPPGGALMYVDGVLLRQVFLNLLLNAFDEFTDGGWIEFRVSRLRRTENSNDELTEHDTMRTAGMRMENFLQITVTDNGPGFPEADLGRAFEPFFTDKETGTGLGLPICERIIHDHGGTIRVQLPPEGGTQFVIELPEKPQSGLQF